MLEPAGWQDTIIVKHDGATDYRAGCLRPIWHRRRCLSPDRPGGRAWPMKTSLRPASSPMHFPKLQQG